MFHKFRIIHENMIRINDKFTKNHIFFNKLTETHSDSVHIKLIGIGEQKYDLGDVNILNEYDEFYDVEIDLSEIPDGEYKWIISVDDLVDGIGLLRIGNLNHNIVQPSFDKDDIIQLQRKNIIKEFDE